VQKAQAASVASSETDAEGGSASGSADNDGVTVLLGSGGSRRRSRRRERLARHFGGPRRLSHATLDLTVKAWCVRLAGLLRHRELIRLPSCRLPRRAHTR
jgi:hypothetical protein